MPNYDDMVTWRIIVGIPMIVVLIRMIVLHCIYTIEPPQFMMEHNNEEDLQKFLKKVYVGEDLGEVYKEIKRQSTVAQKSHA
jgi:hypothetical protein